MNGAGSGPPTAETPATPTAPKTLNGLPSATASDTSSATNSPRPAYKMKRTGKPMPGRTSLGVSPSTTATPTPTASPMVTLTAAPPPVTPSGVSRTPAAESVVRPQVAVDPLSEDPKPAAIESDLVPNGARTALETGTAAAANIAAGPDATSGKIKRPLEGGDGELERVSKRTRHEGEATSVAVATPTPRSAERRRSEQRRSSVPSLGVFHGISDISDDDSDVVVLDGPDQLHSIVALESESQAGTPSGTKKKKKKKGKDKEGKGKDASSSSPAARALLVTPSGRPYVRWFGMTALLIAPDA